MRRRLEEVLRQSQEQTFTLLHQKPFTERFEGLQSLRTRTRFLGGIQHQYEAGAKVGLPEGYRQALQRRSSAEGGGD
jgi:hypothetical protein